MWSRARARMPTRLRTRGRAWVCTACAHALWMVCAQCMMRVCVFVRGGVCVCVCVMERVCDVFVYARAGGECV